MIFTERNITIRNDSATINAPVILYRGDKNVEVRFILIESPYKYSNRDSINIFESTDASYAQLVIKTPNDRDPIFGDITAVGNNNVTFVIRHDMIDEIEEVGKYDFQIRLFDADQTSMATTPEVVGGFIIKEPIAKEDSNNNITNSAIVGSAVVTNDLEIPTFVGGSYNKTAWNDGDVISKQKLNKMEDGIYETYELSKNNSSQIKEKMNKGELISITQIDKNKGKIDETYLSDELLQQIAGNTPIYSTVKDFSLTTRKMGFNVLEGISNGNLFNKYWTVDGFYVSEGDGTLLANDEFFVSEPIPVKPNTTYTINSSNRYAFYDSEVNFINGTIGTGKSETFITPSNAYYFRTCNILKNKNMVTLVEGNVARNLDSYKVLLDPDTIMNKSISKGKLTFGVPNVIPSKNLFDKNTAIENKYVLYSDGLVYVSEGFYASDFIKIEPNTTYTKNNNQQLAFYDADRNFISGLKNPVTSFTTPENSKYVRVTIEEHILDTFQLEKGSESTGYESFGAMLDPNSIRDKSISKNKLAFEVPDMILSKNLFNKDTAIKDRYILYINGIVDTASGFYASDFIKIEPNTTYTKNNNQQLAFYDNEKIFISGLVNPVTTFTTPENAYYVRVTVEENILDTFQLEKGSKSTGYESFDAKIDSKHIKNSNNSTVKNVVTVAKENGDYKTINEALSSIEDSKENQVTIKLAPGEYIESVSTIGRYVSIIGENKDTCIIKTYTNDYYHPPLDCAGNNYFANLTVIADDDGITTPTNGVNNMPAYALHFDISGRYNKDLEKFQGVARFENVIFISKHQHAAGIGISHNQHLIFENCEFISFNDPAFRAHNYQLEGASNEKMTVRNCVMRNDGTYTPIVLQDPNHYAGADDNRDTVFTFINNVAYNAQGKNNCLNVATPLAEGCIAGYIKLGIGSFGNSIDDLNYNS